MTNNLIQAHRRQIEKRTEVQSWLAGEGPLTAEEAALIAGYTSEPTAQQRIITHRRSQLGRVMSGLTPEDAAMSTGDFIESLKDPKKLVEMEQRKHKHRAKLLKWLDS